MWLLEVNTLKIEQAMCDLGVTTGMTKDTKDKYDSRGPNLPVAHLDATRYVVVDVDQAGTLGEFVRQLRAHRAGVAESLPGLLCYVETDKGVSLVYTPDTVGKCLFDGDVRYERISQERGHYAMHLLSKVSGEARRMVSVHKKSVMATYMAEEAYRLAATWSALAQAVAATGQWLPSTNDLATEYLAKELP